MMFSVRQLQLPLEHGGRLQDIALDVDRGDCVLIRTEVLQLGTELLRAFLGLAEHAQGEVLLDGDNVLAPGTHRHLLALRRDVGMVYRQGGLVSVFNIAENIALPLGYHHDVTAQELQEAVVDISVQLGIEQLLPRSVQQLNETEVRLVNLARELIRRPRLLLIDAVMEGLSETMRARVVDAIDQLRRDLDTAIVMTTRRQHLRHETRIMELRDGALYEVAA